MNEYTKPLVDPKDPKHPNQWKKYGFHLPESNGTFSTVLPVKFICDNADNKIKELVDDLWNFRDIRALNDYPLDIKQCKLLVYRSDNGILELETPPVIHNRAYLTGWLEGKYIG